MINHINYYFDSHIFTPPLREPHADAVWSMTDGEELRNRL